MNDDPFNPSLPHACIVCGDKNIVLLNQTYVLGKYATELIACCQCGHEWFNSPSRWLEDAYASPIANTDTGIVTRSLNAHRIISSFLSFSSGVGKILDWGSGSGLLTRLLRDDGYDCYGLEPYTEPVLASGFTFRSQQHAVLEGPYRAIVAIEVVEHLISPHDFFNEALSIADTLIFTTEIVDRAKNGNDWWYYSKETGQHVSFYTQKSLAYIARLHGCNYICSRNKCFHVITRRSLDLQLFRWLVGSRRASIIYPLSKIFGKLSGRCSLAMKDHTSAKQALHPTQLNKLE